MEMNWKFQLAYSAVHKSLPLSTIQQQVFKGDLARYKLWMVQYYQPLYELKVTKTQMERKQVNASAFLQSLVKQLDKYKAEVTRLRTGIRLAQEDLRNQNQFRIFEQLTAAEEQDLRQRFANAYVSGATDLAKEYEEKIKQINTNIQRINKAKQSGEEYQLLVLLNAI